MINIKWTTTKEQRKNEKRLLYLESIESPTFTDAAEIVYLLMLELDLTEKKKDYIIRKMEHRDTVGRARVMKLLEMNLNALNDFRSGKMFQDFSNDIETTEILSKA